ncbi:amidohydrolase [Lentilitoribacter sp. EG35]|uniref:amidohydrolase n=1 Tax=Lentilitoribacter sp. EG35 TaxID=3234192 RepID=UPI0034611074
MITIYNAAKILTMNPQRPEATHVAVRDGRILGVGNLAEVSGWGDFKLDERFAEKVLMPGLVEAHCHLMEGTLWSHTYLGYFDRMDPSGAVQAGCKTIQAGLDKLALAELPLASANEPLTAWGLDPIYFGNERISRHQLDAISSTRPIGILHASGHSMNVNTKALELAGLLREGLEHGGIPLGDDGLPTGELRSPEIMGLASSHVGLAREILACDEPGMWRFAQLCIRAGVTTATDLAALLPDETVDIMQRVTDDPAFPARIVPYRFHLGVNPERLIEHVQSLAKRTTDKLRLGGIKVTVDGSIQGFTARIRAPGYFNGAPNGLWYISIEHLEYILETALAKNIHVHLHTNGDQATELVLDTMEKVLRRVPSSDHRFTLQHCQLADTAQFRRMKKLGLCVNHFANHHYYWGDTHYAQTVGPERAERMNACATALREGVPMAIHSDAPITPLGPLFTAWCATQRLTSSGRVLGETEKITLGQALHAVTVGAAYTLKLDVEIGSIEVGKRADFAVLDDDPFAVGAERLNDLSIWGTVLGGRVFPANPQ